MDKFLLAIIDTTEGFCKPGNPLYVAGAEKVGPAIDVFLEKLYDSQTSLDVLGLLATNDTHFVAEYKFSPEAAVFSFHQGWGTDEQNYTFNLKAADQRLLTAELFKNKFDMWAESSDVGVPADQLAFADDAERDAYENLFYVRMNFEGETPVFYAREDFFRDLRDNDGLTTLVFTGVATDYCVYCGIAGALANGFKAILLEDLCAGIFVPEIPGGTGRYDTEQYQGAANLEDLIEGRPLLKQAQAEGRFQVMSSTQFLNS